MRLKHVVQQEGKEFEQENMACKTYICPVKFFVEFSLKMTLDIGRSIQFFELKQLMALKALLLKTFTNCLN
jgi:hypothetical protein